MDISTWLKILGEILKLMADGFSKEEAVNKAATKFGIPPSSIWKRGGF